MTGIKTAYRLEIEGLGVEAVTDPGLEKTTTDGRKRVVGLLREGLQIEEQVDIARAEIESSGMNVSIVDRQTDSIFTTWFSRRATTRTYMTASLLSTSTGNVYVDSTTGFAVDDFFHVGTECMQVVAVGSDGGGPYIEPKRAQWSTTAQYHYTADGDELVRPVVTHTYPTTIEGRRARLYRYVVGEDSLQGDGTQVWLGLCTTDAKLKDGTTWSIQIDPITSIFAEDLGSDLEEPFLPRGIHYPEDAPLDFIFGKDTVGEDATDGRVASTSIDPTKAVKLRIVGFWETNADFCEDMTTALNEGILVSPSSPTVTLNGGVAEILQGPLSADIALDSITANPHGSGWAITLEAGSDGGLAFDAGGLNAEGRPRTYDFTGTGAVSTGESVKYVFADGQVPRGNHGRSRFLTGEVDMDADYSGADVYVDNPVTADANDELEMTIPTRDEPYFNSIASVSSTLNRIRLDSMPEAFSYSPSLGLPEYRVRRHYVTGTLYNFLATLSASAPADANKGAQPFLVASDLDIDPDVFTEAERGLPLLSIRRYLSSAEIELGELIAHECRLLGMFPHLSSAGKLTFSLLTLPTATTPVDFTIDDSNRIVDGDWPTWERNAWGSFNTVTIRTAYDPTEEEHTGPTFQVRDLTALSTRKNTRELEIAPLSLDTHGFGAGGGYDWTYDDAVVISQKVLGIFGRPYVRIVFEAPYTLATTALVGSVGRVAFPRLPDTTTGQRGLTEAVGLVTGRMWALDMEERVQLTMIVTDEPIAGYAPSATLTNAVDGGGDQWEFDHSLTDPEGIESMAPSGVTFADLFQVGDVVEVVEWNDATQGPQQGTISVITDTVVTIDFDSTFTEPTTYYLRFAAAGQVDAEQEDFAFWAASDSEIDFASGATAANVWAA